MKSPIGILFYDKEGKLIAANQSAKDIAGIPESEDVSVNLFNNLDVVSRKEKLIGEGVIKFQSQMNFEDMRDAGYYEPTRSGTAYLDFTISVVDSGYLVQIQDITKRKKIEERLTENEKKYRELVENANSIILKMDKKGQITFFNEFAEKFFGFNKEKIMGKNVIGTIVPETESSGRNLREIINRIVSDPESHINMENENITHDTRRVWVAWTNKGIYNDDGEVTGVLSIGTDITKRKNAENAFKHLMLETSKSKNLILKELREAHDNLELKVQKRTRELNESNCALRKEIQERKHVEYKLKEQLNFLQHLIDVIPVPIFYKDINYVYVGCNHAFEEVMGIYRENIIGKTQYDIAPKELADKHYEMDQKLFENPGTQVYETLLRYADNTMHSVVFNKATYTDIEGNIIGLIGVIIDITGVKKAEEKIRRLADIVESSDDAIISHTFDGIITSWNKGAEKVYGYSAREMLGKHAYAALNPSQYEEVKRNMEKVKNGMKLAHYESKRIRKDGKEIYVSVNLSPIINPEGKLTGVSVIARDITESKKIEEDLIKSRNYLDKIINSIADPVFVKDNQHRWILLNDAYCKLMGYSREEILGKSDYDFFPSHEADIFWEKDEEVFKTGVENVNEEEFTDSDGNIHILLTKKTLYTDISGEQYIVASIRDITERKKTENNLRQSERKLTLAMDMAKLAYWEYDVSLDLFTFDDRFYKLYGTTADHEGGSKMSSEEYAQKFLPPEESHLVNEEMAKALKTDDPDFFGQVEHTIIRADGEKRFIIVRYGVIKDDEGRTIKTYGANQDITELKKAEAALKDSEAMFRGIFDNATDMISLIECSKDGKYMRYIEVNNAGIKRLGYSKDEFLNMGPFDIDEGLETPENMKRLSKEGHVRFETIHVAKNGRRIPVEVIIHFINRNATDVALEISRDITERKKAEYELKKSEQKYRTLFNSSPDSTILIGTDGNLMDVNHAAQEVTGLSKKDLTGKNFTELELLLDEEMPLHIEKVSQVLRGKNLKPYESRFIDKKGKIHYAETYLKALKKDDEIFAFNVIAHDITERKKAEEKLKETIEELERSNYELQQFAYITSHDLQEPLRTIASFTQLLERRYGGQLDSDADEFIEFIVDAAVRMKEMIQGLLEYSRVGTQKVEFKEVNMNVELGQALSNLHALITKNKAEITHDPLPDVMADSDQMVRVFQNLISNAIKFRKPGEPTKIHISCQIDKENNEYIFSVADNGIGIEKEYKDKIFEVFKRLHAMGKYEGTGIGLSVVKRIIEQYDGRIWVESELGRGSTFYFTLPFTHSKDL